MTSNDKVPELTSGEFENFTKEGVVLVDFFADWCMPCVMMAPVLDDLCEEFHGKVKCGKINVDENKDLAMKFNVSSIPNFVLFKDGKLVEQVMGSMTQEELGNVVKSYI